MIIYMLYTNTRTQNHADMPSIHTKMLASMFVVTEYINYEETQNIHVCQCLY